MFNLLTLSKQISFFGLDINYYSLFIFLAIIYCWWTIKGKIVDVYQKEDNKIENLLIIAVVGGILGARFWYVVSNLGNYSNNWLNVFAIWQGGIAIHGAVVGGFLATYLFWKKQNYGLKFDFFLICDIIFPVILIGQFIGRWGNFYNQEIYGSIISENLTGQLITVFYNLEMILALCVLFLNRKGIKKFFINIKERKNYFELTLFVYVIFNIINYWFFGFNDFMLRWMKINGQHRVPLFLIEGTLNLILYVGIILSQKWKYFTGRNMGIYLIGYGVIRGILEPLRNQIDIMKIFGIYVSVIVSIAFVIAGSIFIYLRHKYLKTKPQ